MELRRVGGDWLTEDTIGGSWFDPDSNVGGMGAELTDDSARVRFFGLPDGLGETERRSNCEEAGEWLGMPIRSGSNSLGGGG